MTIIILLKIGVFLAPIILGILAFKKAGENTIRLRRLEDRLDELTWGISTIKSTVAEKKPDPLLTIPLPPPPKVEQVNEQEVEKEEKVASISKTPPAPKAPVAPIKPAWTAPVIDWENFTGIKLFGWLGGLALFLGAAFFVKYSIDHGWISPAVRVAFGFLLGIGVIIGGLKLRNKGNDVTVQVLAASGIAILYADIFAAASMYRFLPVLAAFGLMTLVTALSFLLSVRLNSRYVAILGLIGGFLTPPLLSTGVDNPLGLFGYIAFLNIGLMSIAIRKKWTFLLAMAAGATALIQWGWLAKFFTIEKVGTGAAVFLFFPALYFMLQEWAAKINQDDEWTRGVSAVFPLICSFFTAVMLSFPGLGLRPGLIFSFLFLLDGMGGLMAFRIKEGQQAHTLLGVLTFLFLGYWTSQYLTLGLLPWALSFYLLFGIFYAAYSVLLLKKFPDSKHLHMGSLFPALILIVMLIPFLNGELTSVMIWPVVLVLNAAGFIIGVMTGFLWAIAAVIILTILIGINWIHCLPNPAGLGALLIFILFFSLGLMALTLFMKKKGRLNISSIIFDTFELSPTAFLTALPALLPFILLIFANVTLQLINPTPTFALGALLAILLLSLVRYLKVDPLSPVTLLSVAALEYAWFAKHLPLPLPSIFIIWNILFFILFFSFPFAFMHRMKNRSLPWAASALAGPVHFYLIYKFCAANVGTSLIGLLPAAFAVIYILGAIKLVKTFQEKNHTKNTPLAFFGGVALFFISLIFPLQFEKQWITLGWAIEGVALIWLFKRLRHPGIKYWAQAMLALAFIRLAINPAVFGYHPGSNLPILNWYLYTYGIAAACFFTASKLWTLDGKNRWNQPTPTIMSALGGILTFLLLNIEIADFFSTGQHLTFQFSGSLAQDMTYSLAWALYGVTLIVFGIKLARPYVRYSGMGLMVITLFKLFLHDLWRLGQLYRVGAFMGLAIVLIFVSYIYQRYGSSAGTHQPPAAKGDPS